MTYNRSEFRALKNTLQKTLIDEDGEPLSCQLYNAPFSHGTLSVDLGDGHHESFHVAEACNIAGVISSVDRILSLPRSNIACEELAEVLLLRLDVLREYICAAVKGSLQGSYAESDADKVVRRWAGFLKHPSEYIFAHKCLSSWDMDFDSPTIEINGTFLANWDNLKPKERDQKKSDLAHRIVSVKLPDIGEIEAFFMSSADHLQKLITASSA